MQTVPERENFLPADSWPVFVSLCKDRQIIKLRHTEDFQEYRYASELYGDCKAVRNARIATVSRESEDIRAPAPYNLTELQKDANRYHNLTAIQVQDITQGLYEKKLISYPRTASRLLTRDVYDTLPAVMERFFPQGIPPIRQNERTLPRRQATSAHRRRQITTRSLSPACPPEH